MISTTTDDGYTVTSSDFDTEAELRANLAPKPVKDTNAPASDAAATSAADPAVGGEAQPRGADGKFVSAKADAPAADAKPAAKAEAVTDDIDVETGLDKKARPYKLVRQYQEQASKVNAELAQLRAEVASMRAQKAVAAPAPAADGEPSEDEIGTKYATWGEFAKAVAKWQLKQERAELAKEFDEKYSARDRQKEQVSSVQTIQKAGAAKYQDFQQVIDAAERWSPLVERIVFSDVSRAHDLAYALAKDPGEARRLSAIADPVLAGVEMGQFLARMQAASTTGPAQSETSHAKPPIKPVGASSVASDDPPPDEADYDAHAAYWNRKEGRARRRS